MNDQPSPHPPTHRWWCETCGQSGTVVADEDGVWQAVVEAHRAAAPDCLRYTIGQQPLSRKD